jgi:D-alanyl-D-alanine carboxypeptidase
MKRLLIRMGRSRVSMAVVFGLLTCACASSTQHGSSSTPSSSPVEATYTLGHFPGVPTRHFSDSTAAALQPVLDAAVEQGLPGVTATVLAGNRGAWSGAAGTADGVHPVKVQSQFAIASITKTVIAAEIMWLSEQGLLRLSDPVSEHLPSGFHFDTNGATIGNLLAMESGIPDPAPPDVLANPRRDWKAEQMLASVPAYRNEPGDHFVYEDANYMLLGLVVEKTTGVSVAAALRSHVLADPRLSSMVYQSEERPKGPLALPFLGGQVRPNIVKVGGGYLPTEAEASAPSGSGGMASDSGALALWGYLLFGRHLLSQQSLRAMTDFGSGASYDRYGLGVFDQTHLANGFGVLAVGNGGWDTGGYSSALTVLPSQGIVISVLTNTAGDPVTLVFPVVQKLASALRE